MRKHLSDHWSDHELDNEVKKYFQLHFMNTLFPFTIPRMSTDWMSQHITIKGEEYLQQTMTKGNGCILLQGHIGIVQLPLFYLNKQEYNLGQVFFRQSTGLSLIGRKIQLKYREKMEQKLEVRLFPVKGFQRPLLRWLKDNNILMLNGDGIGGLEFVGRYEVFPFLGTRARFPLGPYNVAMRLDTPILPTSVSFENNHFTITISEPLTTSFSGEEAFHDLAEQFLRFLEKQIIDQPYSWHFWDGFCEGIIIPGDND